MQTILTEIFAAKVETIMFRTKQNLRYDTTAIRSPNIEVEEQPSTEPDQLEVMSHLDITAAIL